MRAAVRGSNRAEGRPCAGGPFQFALAVAPVGELLTDPTGSTDDLRHPDTAHFVAVVECHCDTCCTALEAAKRGSTGTDRHGEGEGEGCMRSAACRAAERLRGTACRAA